MKSKSIIVAVFCLCALAAVVPLLSSDTGGPDAVAAITKLENESMKTALANDISFTKNNLADDYVAGTSFGEWETKASLIQDAADPTNNKTNTMTIADLKVTPHGNTVIARYLNTYDDVYHGTHRSRSVICTDTWVKDGEAWKMIANHCSQAKQ